MYSGYWDCRVIRLIKIIRVTRMIRLIRPWRGVGCMSYTQAEEYLDSHDVARGNR
jgi:hypothetical protein